MTDLERRTRANNPPPRTVLVTGATGFLGSHLVRRLLSSGVHVRVLVRSAAMAKSFAERGVAVVLGEITDRRKLRDAVDGAAVIYHLAGRLLVPGVPAAEYHRTHVEGVNVLLSVCEAEPGVGRLVHVSTTGVVGVTGTRPADETAPIRPTNVYESTKAEAELLIRAAWLDGFPAVIARPGLVYGPGDLHLLPFFRSVLRRQFRPIGSLPVWLHPIYVDDLTEGLVRCGERPRAAGECFHLAGPQPVSLGDLAHEIAQAGGTRLPPGHIPVKAARALAVVGDQLPTGLKRSAPLTRSRLEFLTHSRIYDVTKAARLLDFTATTALSTGIAQTIAWYRSQGYLAAAAA